MSNIKMEQLQEGWVKFIRYYCKEGHIDRWMGDCINDPNRETKSPLQLNSFAIYWRFNGGKWISSRKIGGYDIPLFIAMGEEFSAKEIWDELVRKYKYETGNN